MTLNEIYIFVNLFSNKQTILWHGVVLVLLYGTRACRIWLLVVPIYRARTTPCRNIVWLFWESTLYWHSIIIHYKLNRHWFYTQLVINLNSISGPLTLHWHSMGNDFENFFFENKQTILRHGVVLALLYGTRACQIWLMVVPIYRARTTPCRNIVWLFWAFTLYWHSINIQYTRKRQSI